MWSAGCGEDPEEGMVIGIHLQACDYSFTPSNLLDEGSDRIIELGSKAIGIYIGPEYADYYPGSECDAANLAELAASPAYRRLFGKPLKVYSLTSYAFANGLDGRWQQGIESYDHRAAYSEIRALCEYLLREYAGSGKTFIIKNWEGDWHLLGGYLRNTEPAEKAVAAMIGWMEARISAVRDAREAVGAGGVFVYSAVEFNLVRMGQGGRRTMLTEVVPHLSADLYSYSAWDGIQRPGKIPERLDFIKRYAADSEAFGNRNVFLGEIGVADKVEDKVNILRWALDAGRKWGVPFAFVWQLYDNECDGKALYPAGDDERAALSCRGFWLIDKYGELTPTGSMVKHYIAGDYEE